MKYLLLFFFTVACAMQKDLSLPESINHDNFSPIYVPELTNHERLCKEAVTFFQDDSIKLLEKSIIYLSDEYKNQTISLGDDRIYEYLACCKYKAKEELKKNVLTKEEIAILTINLYSIKLAKAINYAIQLSNQLKEEDNSTHNNNV